MLFVLHKQHFVTAHSEFITAHFVFHCTLKNALATIGFVLSRKFVQLLQVRQVNFWGLLKQASYLEVDRKRKF